MCLWAWLVKATGTVAVDAAGFEARLGLMVLIIARSLSLQSESNSTQQPVQLSFTLHLQDRLLRRDSICPVICPHHMPRPWSFKVSCLIWHFQAVMKRPERALAQSQMHLACCILFLFISAHCYDQLSQTDYQHWSQIHEGHLNYKVLFPCI